MAEVTRVPIRPVSKGSLLMLFLGILIGLAIAGAAAWLSMPPSVSVETVREGTGETPAESDVVFVHYVGKLEDGTEFDRSQDAQLPVEGVFPKGTPLPLDQMLPGFREGLMKMQRGGKYELFIPADQAYGASPPPGAPIPPDADLYFEIEVVDFMPRSDFDRRLMVLQQMMQSQAGPEGGEGAAPPAATPAP